MDLDPSPLFTSLGPKVLHRRLALDVLVGRVLLPHGLPLPDGLVNGVERESASMSQPPLVYLRILLSTFPSALQLLVPTNFCVWISYGLQNLRGRRRKDGLGL